jgi:hypothetical protein
MYCPHHCHETSREAGEDAFLNRHLVHDGKDFVDQRFVRYCLGRKRPSRDGPFYVHVLRLLELFKQDRPDPLGIIETYADFAKPLQKRFDARPSTSPDISRSNNGLLQLERGR